MTYFAGVIKIVGSVIVEKPAVMEPGEIRLDIDYICGPTILNISTPSILQPLAKPHVRRPVDIQFVVQQSNVRREGEIVVTGGLTIQLVGPRQYEIQMPWVIDVPRGSCYRTLDMKPGFDTPLSVSSGKYHVYIRGSCNYAGWGKVEVKITLGLKVEGDNN
ncbi:MAG: hypothetical protein ACPL3C_03795 [Pyrobaculum sp.]